MTIAKIPTDNLPLRIRSPPVIREPITNAFPTVKDKAQHAVILDKQTGEKLQKDVQSYRLITVAVLVDRLKINGSLARKALADLEEKGQIKKVVAHSACNIYSKWQFCDTLGYSWRGGLTSVTARAVGGGD